MRTLGIFLATSLFLYGQRSEGPKVISVCELLRSYASYNGRIVHVRGEYSPWDHGVYLRGEGCDGLLDAEGFPWPIAVSLEAGQKRLEAKGKTAGVFSQAMDTIASAIRAKLRQTGALEARKVTATFVGLFETRASLREKPGLGFGPLGSAPGEFFVDSVTDVSVEVETQRQPR